MNALFVGIDTSCYTTSLACVSEEGIVFDERTVLSVPLGACGLRQSDAIFQHVRNLPNLLDTLFGAIDPARVCAVSVSARPTAAEQSYMPVFLAGVSSAHAIAGALHTPLFENTHQAGHLRAALLGNERLLQEPRFLAMHISGGTTDLVSVETEAGQLGRITLLGDGSDLHAGQFVDRIGVQMGLPFPSGRHLETLARRAEKRDCKLPASVDGLRCSFSGQETRARRLLEGGEAKETVAYAVYDCMARTFSKMIERACEASGCADVLLSGGVAGSLLLRECIAERTDKHLFFARDGLSSDNAVGAALLARDRYRA